MVSSHLHMVVLLRVHSSKVKNACLGVKFHVLDCESEGDLNFGTRHGSCGAFSLDLSESCCSDSVPNINEFVRVPHVLISFCRESDTP